MKKFNSIRFSSHCLSALILVLAAISAKAQEPLALSRYNDNFKVLAADTTHRFTLFPELKQIRLFNSDNTNISFGGEIREEALDFTHQNWDATPAGSKTIRSDDPFLLQRYMFHSNLVLSPYFRLFAELKSGLENGETTVPRPQIDVDRLDINQAFADINLFPEQATTLTIRGGRQELDYGASRLISENEGPNVRLAFQGLKFILKSPIVRVDGFFTRPVNNSPGIFDDGPIETEKLFGIYATILLPEKSKSLLDLYILGNTNQNAVYIKGKGNESRRSYGARLFSKKISTVTYDFEGTYQNGNFKDETIRAFGAVARINYNFLDNGIVQTISLVGQTVSGDKGTTNELNTFNPLFTRDYYGVGTPYWASNIMQVTPSVNLKLTPNFLAYADVHFLWRENINDGLYLVVPTRSPYIYNTTTVSKHRFIGAQQDLNLTYNFTKYWLVDAEFIYLPTTAYISDTGYGKNYLFTLLQTKFRF